MSAIVTLIPAYKTNYLGDLFMGLRTQKFKSFRVVLSDDSPGGEITESIRAGVYGPLARELNLLVVRGPRQGSQKNIQHLIEGWGDIAPLVHVHLDDDIVYPDFYRAHADVHARKSFGASVSLRWVTSTDGHPHQDLPLPLLLEEGNARIVVVTADQLFASTVARCENWLGEISNMVLSAEGARRYAHSRMGGMSYYGLGDVGVLLDISRHASIAVIRDHLSGFRSNPQQASSQLQSFGLKCGHLAWVAIALAAWGDGRISPQQTVQSLSIAIRRSAHLYAGDAQMEPFFALFEEYSHDLGSLAEAFKTLWAAFLEDHPDSRHWIPRPKGLFARASTSSDEAVRD
ncbi:MAG: hypothetical protein ACK53K_07040 [Burkholderiales bacterium]